MNESLKSKILRWKLNFFPAYRETGARITFISADWKEVRIKLPLNWRTRNYVGTIFGGSMYGAIDPIYMMMLIKILGSEYIVWDKAATIHFKKPGKQTLYAIFALPNKEVLFIKEAADKSASIDRIYKVQLVDNTGTVYAEIDKTVYIRKIK